MSWLFGRGGGGHCTAEEIEKAKRKTMATEQALKSVKVRKAAVLAKEPAAHIYIRHNDNETTFSAYDASGNVLVAQETHTHY